jgi:hypothetical protein
VGDLPESLAEYDEASLRCHDRDSVPIRGRRPVTSIN